ncbi:DUF6188 family protein [Streptomyces rubellomurinus]|uniref:Uncharacterized protein n=1 Tax=Streptomyces rubellomurinus (strain ATCC 31215) TaxID=359131 RepID=A0A0F2TIV4_STRR3|nr:DUF6188 family protein [Streptomyces rubellomurinus]KJS61647.1 hypothetical protein VM95_13715 [Streptomyces rubellomurinus]
MRNGIAELLAGRRVESVGGGTRLELGLTGRVSVLVVQDFRFAAPPPAGPVADGPASGAPATVEHVFPALAFRPTAALSALVGRTVESALITLAGGLELGFAGGGVLSVPPDARLAPWSVLGAEGVLCAGLPGGEVVWAEAEAGAG